MSPVPSISSEHRLRSRLPSAGACATRSAFQLSIGVASTKHLAKVASQVAKPDGLVAVAPGDEIDFLDPLPVGLIWGVGAATERRLHEVGIFTIGQLAQAGSPILANLLGQAAGTKLAALSANLDERAVETQARAKSMGAQAALGRREATPQLVRETLAYLADRVAARLRKAMLAGRTVTVRVRFAHLRSVTRSLTLPTAISTTLTLTEVAETLAHAAIRDNEREREISLLAVSVSNLRPEHSLQLELPVDSPAWPRDTGHPAAIGRRGRAMGSGSVRRRDPGQVRPDRRRLRRGRPLRRRTSSRGVPRTGRAGSGWQSGRRMRAAGLGPAEGLGRSVRRRRRSAGPAAGSRSPPRRGGAGACRARGSRGRRARCRRSPRAGSSRCGSRPRCG